MERERENILDPGGNSSGETPFDLKLFSKGSDVTVRWNRLDDDGIVSYRVYRSLREDSMELRATVGRDSIAFTDTDLIDERAYYYRVSAVFENGNESGFSRTDKIVPGPTVNWVLDFSSDMLIELTHDAMHRTGRSFMLNAPISFDIDRFTGTIFAIEQIEDRIVIMKSDSVKEYIRIEADSLVMDPRVVGFDSERKQLWVANGFGGNVFRIDFNSGSATSYLIEGEISEIQVDRIRGECWAVDREGRYIKIVTFIDGIANLLVVGPFQSSSLMLALDESRSGAWVGDRQAGTLGWVDLSGELTPITSIPNMGLGAAEPVTGNLWLLAKPSNSDNYSLMKLSGDGTRLFEVSNVAVSPSWIAVNPSNNNCVVADKAAGKIKVYSSQGILLDTNEEINWPATGRIIFDTIE